MDQGTVRPEGRRVSKEVAGAEVGVEEKRSS
jgi:hypothetical protein